MGLQKVSIALLLFLVASVSAFIRHPSKGGWAELNERFHREAQKDTDPGNWLPYSERYWSQPLDNFDPSNGVTWAQRYQYMEAYWNGTTDSPVVFLFIGGEGPIYSSWVNYAPVQYLKWAKHFGALVYQVEHRFFGYSRPLADMAMGNLKYLTPKQALADLANFIRSENMKRGLKNPRWVTFGGSYPGSLAAWFRSKYPDLTVGSVASSAPLVQKLNFNEYAEVVENTIRNVSDECADVVSKSFEVLGKMALTSNGRSQLNTIYRLNPPFDDKDVNPTQIQNFMAGVYTVFQSIIQYTYDGLNTNTQSVWTAKNLCDIMTSTATPLSTDLDYAQRPMKVVELYDGPNVTMNNDYTSSWAEAKDIYFSFEGTGRGWMWLCCNGLGWLQSTDWGHGIFHDSVPFNYYTKVCSDIFSPEIGPAYIRDQNHASQEYYGGLDHFNATNLFLPNGSLDPWHALGYYKTDEKNHVISYLIPGTAHCGDMYAHWDGPTAPALKKVHDKILSELEYYVQAK